MDAQISPRQEYVQWVEDRIEDHKSALTREELLSLADQAVDGLYDTADGQYPLTEILLRDAVDALIFRRLRLPTYRQWLKSYRSDTPRRPPEGTAPRGDDVAKDT
ncbi:MAG: hypothetical protein KY466_07015 [Gemmatimonadetes bacterium]|nr:hypothetical protein [Gemmatimonadota bacterium]